MSFGGWQTIARDFGELIGSEYVRTDENTKQTYGRDWTKVYPSNPSMVVFPANTHEVSLILKYCNERKIAVVPSGGRTGLAGAAVSTNQEVVISLDRLNKIEEIDEVGLTMKVEAGVTTHAVQKAAEAAGLFFGLDLAAKGSCQIGGNVATNAGGLKLIRYGGTREQVLGLEVVLASGEVLDLNSSLRKNNVGYDLKQLFIGSEGTLGIVTKVTLKLLPRPGELSLCCLALQNFSDIAELLRLSNKKGLQLSAFEFFDRGALQTVLKYMPFCRSPFSEVPNYSVLLEMETVGEQEKFDELITDAFNSGLIVDGVVASSSQQFHELWALRENISEAVTNVGFVAKNDISVPVAALRDFVQQLSELMEHIPSDIQLVVFGHIGDGNLHLNYLGPNSLGIERFRDLVRDVEQKVFGILQTIGGSISAEHGIGLLKKNDLHFSCPQLAVDYMKRIKQVFDPNQILNPGKIFDQNS